MTIKKNNDSDFERLETIYNLMLHDMANQLTTDYHSQAWVINHYFKKAYKKYKELKGGKQNMKVMISLPMRNRSEEEIKKQIKDISELFAKLHIDTVDNFFKDEAKGYNNEALYYLGRSIDLIGTVDAVYFADGWQGARGCRIERQVCEAYNIMILDSTFFKHENNVHIRSDFINNNIRVVPCKNDPNDYISKLNVQFGPDTYKHIPQIHDMEEEND